MNNYPPKGCEISRLVTHPRMVAAVLSGTKTEQRRNDLYAYPDETFTLEGVAFVVTAVERARLGDMSDADARAEGYPDLAAYKGVILAMHKGMSWDEDALVWVHRFKRV